MQYEPTLSRFTPINIDFFFSRLYDHLRDLYNMAKMGRRRTWNNLSELTRRVSRIDSHI